MCESGEKLIFNIFQPISAANLAQVGKIGLDSQLIGISEEHCAGDNPFFSFSFHTFPHSIGAKMNESDVCEHSNFFWFFHRFETHLPVLTLIFSQICDEKRKIWINTKTFFNYFPKWNVHIDMYIHTGLFIMILTFTMAHSTDHIIGDWLVWGPWRAL